MVRWSFKAPSNLVRLGFAASTRGGDEKEEDGGGMEERDGREGWRRGRREASEGGGRRGREEREEGGE